MNQSKYEWYGDNSIFASDDKTIRDLESWLVSDQYNPSEVVKTLVDVTEAVSPEFRICIPKQWEETVQATLCGDA